MRQRGICTVLGCLLSLYWIGLAYHEDLSKFPRYSIFLMLCLFHFIYSGVSLILFRATILKKAKHYLRYLELARSVKELTEKLKAIKIKEGLRSIKEGEEVKFVDEECGICLSDLFGEEERREVSEVKKCGHLFHAHCITQWLRICNTCPTDRRPI